ncbi:UDP-N-acetylmuramoyl-tripeptide--D-alanyl-D-alanine ligase [Acinetobacter rathckeae]|uniref:UDP-N-acetylmuramoyl-tripeptide--D-alanyl-D- alanine ligase n=1 Tax=Acinetobacter rathckeae TaxID=2605272 RepID=UPI0018A28C64|nr:UDP-N-acetylmuramoyl-tripeptide--D-alanyl-D-alanine ligase [Acinetobacter rathckeae]MBF7688700.1 UDP-N-acetylmuramoyl-tripeptide--D-alanyl-D-alanine ligase [Acinetobacter rathckeae]MBF7696093.1 UDP-N-acetylmuramoyl-tripeptide--D-alanyl-D-alanine ligase [Acinetobacter rathckeae]
MHTSTTSTNALMPWSAQDLAQATQGSWYKERTPNTQIKRILTNSRHAESGDAFLALKGERFDAHTFVAQVQTQGCEVAIVERPIDDVEIYQLVVADTRLALGLLGAFRRKSCHDLKVVALTGSSGKTTTKEMLGSIFSQLAPTLVTRGNLNNDLGVPMMLLELTEQHRYAVMELGANHQGEIDYTSHLVAPDVAGILNIGTAHLGEFGGREGICQAKSEIYQHLKASGCAIVPKNDDFTVKIEQKTQSFQCLSFGEGGDVYATDIQLQSESTIFLLHTPKGITQIDLPFAGAHNVDNALAATAFALALDVPLQVIAQGLASAVAAKGRLNFIRKKQYLCIDDTYNANPTSMLAASHVLSQQQGIKVLVMGDIGELGDTATSEHQKLGEQLSHFAIDQIVAVGEYAQAVSVAATGPVPVAHFETQAQALPYLIEMIKKHQPQTMSFLFKGSRFTHMETLMADLMETL